MMMRRAYSIALLVTLIALAAHVYENFFMGYDSGSLGWLMWWLMPYLLCLGISFRSTFGILAAIGVAIVFAVDVAIHYITYMYPTGIASKFPLVLAPIVTTVLIALTAMVIARRSGRQRPNAA